MLGLKADTRLALGNEIIIQAIRELSHYYAFNTNTGDHFELNHTAYWILEEVGPGITLAELSERFVEQFEINRDAAQRDLSEILEFALGANILKEVAK